jgi:hypothetical protein
MESTIENNKLMAEFMGYINNGDSEFLIHPETNYDHSINDKDWFLYHKSWDWLMPVVEKISTLCLTISVHGNGCTIFHYFENGRPKAETIKVYTGEAGIKNVRTPKEATYKAVVEFIKWYNENK